VDGHLVVHGNPSSDSTSCGALSSTRTEDQLCVAAGDDETAGIRCCNDDGEGASFCGDPPSTGGDTCTTHSLALAQATCEANGYRLCTASEILSGQTIGTGCSYDAMKVWSSTSCGMPTIECTTTLYVDDVNDPPFIADNQGLPSVHPSVLLSFHSSSFRPSVLSCPSSPTLPHSIRCFPLPSKYFTFKSNRWKASG
jgi:hypothetical protein